MSDPGRAAWEGLELELRQMGGVVAVSIDRHVQPRVVLTVESAADAALAAAAGRLVAAAAGDPPAVVEVVRLPGLPAPGPAGNRVRLLRVATGPDDRVEVELAHEGRVSIGRGRRLAGAVRATLEALAGLGADVPFELRTVAVLGPQPGSPVAVRLEARGGGRPRLGVAAGDFAAEAAGKATLQALNRHLDRALPPMASGAPGRPSRNP